MPVVTAVDDLIELVVKGNYDLVAEINNVFHYQVTNVGTGTGAPATLEEWAAGFVENVLPFMIGLLTASVTYTSIEARLLDNVTGALVNGVPVPIPSGLGNSGSEVDTLPPSDCYTFRFVRPDSTFRHGYKRLSGIAEASQVDGVATGAILTGLNDAANVFSNDLEAWTLTDGAPDTQVTDAAAHPVVVQRQKNGDILNPINIAVITNVIYTKIGTQNSRKFGVGS